MLSRFFSNYYRVLFLLLFIVEFYRFRPLPFFLEEVPNTTLLFTIFLFLLLSFISRGNKQSSTNRFSRLYSYMMILLFIFAIINCYSCLYYRHQSLIETFKAWAPIFILYLYYPLSQFRISVNDWEKILYTLFEIIILVHLISTIFPRLQLFQMTSGYEKFLEEGRCRAYSNVILWLGNIICFNKWMVNENIKYNVFLFFISLVLIILTGYRIMLFADLLVCAIIYVKIKGMKLKYMVLSILFGGISLFVLSNISMVKNRWNEVMERNETQNLDNEDYIRVVLINYYYTEYFNSPWELLFGSGMVERKFGMITKDTKYPSMYSKELSDQMTDEKLMPIDVGLIGLSWEAGIPAVLLLIVICIVLTIEKQDKKYLYIRAWGLFLLMISSLNPRFYYNHNMIYTVIIWLIFIQLQYEKDKSISLYS